MSVAFTFSAPLRHRSRGAAVRLEDAAPEETAIRRIDREIDAVEKKGGNANSLIRERDSQYRAWIDRLMQQIVKDPDRRDYLEGQLERARRSYGERSPKAG